MKTTSTKRLLCLLLCMIMMLGLVLTSCSEKSKDEVQADIQEEASEKAMTLSLYLMSEKKVDPSVERAIENAVNKITKAKFTTQIDLRYYTEEEYYQAVEAAFAARDEAKANGTLQDDMVAVESDTDEDSGAIIDIVYPDIAPYQVDLFYFGGQDRYEKYLSEDRLSNLGSELSATGASGSLRKFISPHFFTAVSALGGRSGQIRALPTNKAIGQYTYLLLNKQALNDAMRRVDGVAIDESLYTSLTCSDTKDFLTFVKEWLSEKYAPLYTNLNEKELLISNLQYFGLDEDTFSVIGNYVNANANFQDTDAYGDLENLFENKEFVADLETLSQYKTGGYYCDEDEEKPFAVGYVTGGAELVDVYGEDYEMIVIEKPRMTSEDVYSDMFGVAYCTADVGRSMEILTYLNSNEEFRNLILYGVEGVHYNLLQVGVDGGEVDEDDENSEVYPMVRRLNVGTELEYKMSVHRTGNELLAYPEEGTSPKINEYAVTQNSDALIDLYCGFVNDYGTVTVDRDELKAIKSLSNSLLDKYLACKNAAEFQTFLADAKSAVAASDAVTNQLNSKNKTSLAYSYSQWKSAMKIK